MAKQKQDELNEELANGFDSKAMLAKNASNKTVVSVNGVSKTYGTVIRYNDRQTVKIKADTRHYKEGQIINPHKIVAESLIEQGVAEAYTPKKEDND